MITSSTFLPTSLNFRRSLGLHSRAYLMFRHGCTTINFNWILIRQIWFSPLLNTTRKACLTLSLSIWMEPRFICLQASATWASFSPRISLFSSMSPAPVKSANSNCVESILSVATCHKMYQDTNLCFCPVQSRLLQFSTRWLSEAAHSQTWKSSEQRCKAHLSNS